LAILSRSSAATGRHYSFSHAIGPAVKISKPYVNNNFTV
jgi:hypothetical protein